MPASYLRLETPSLTPSIANQTPATQNSSGSGQHGKHFNERIGLSLSWVVRVIYSYEAQGKDELDLIEGETVELTRGPAGGQSYGDGWWEGVHFLIRWTFHMEPIIPL